jgi:hypothetical protein
MIQTLLVIIVYSVVHYSRIQQSLVFQWFVAWCVDIFSKNLASDCFPLSGQPKMGLFRALGTHAIARRVFHAAPPPPHGRIRPVAGSERNCSGTFSYSRGCRCSACNAYWRWPVIMLGQTRR